MTLEDTPLETDVPAGETPADSCPYCDRPFRTERLRTLHVGEQHPDACTDEELGAYREARERERDDLFTFHFQVVFAVGFVYFVLVLLLVILL